MRRALVGTSQKESARTKPCKEPVLRAANPRRRAGSRVQGVEERNGSCRPRRRSRLAEGVVSLGSVKTLMKETSEFVNRGRANSESEQLGALPPDPQDLSLSCQNLVWVGGASPSRSRPNPGPWVGAQVASLRCPILRPGHPQYTPKRADAHRRGSRTRKNASRMPPDQRSDRGTTVSTTQKSTEIFTEAATTAEWHEKAHEPSSNISDGLTAQAKATFPNVDTGTPDLPGESRKGRKTP